MRSRETQLLIDHLGNALGIGYWYLDLATNEMYWAEQTYKVHGVSPESYTPDINTAILLYHPEDRAEIERRVAYVLENKAPYTGVSRIITASKEVRWIKATLDCEVDEEGNPIGLLGTGEEISEEIVEESQLEMALSIANIGIWNWDIATSTIFGNDRSRRIGGEEAHAGEEIVHTLDSFLGRVHEAERTYVEYELNKTISTEDYLYAVEFRYQVADDVYRWVKSVGQIVEVDADNKPLRMTGLLIDIHESKVVQDELRHALEEAERANRARGEFLANMSHEVRTPMNGILGLTELLVGSSLDEEQREYAKLIKRSGEALLRILNDILDFSKIESGKMEISPTVFSLEDFVHDMELLHFNDQSKIHDFTLHLDPALPGYLYADPYRLRQVLDNLLSNAIKFTPPAGAIDLSIQLQEKSGRRIIVLFSVKDSGIGIPLEKQKSIFEAFNQADASTTRKYGGTGLGLTISAKLVEQMGGTLWLESVPGQGATFFFTVAIEEGQPTREKEQVSSHKLKTSLRILVAEDNLVNQRLIDKVLRNEGHHVTIAKNGKEAIEQFQQNAFDAVLMDIQMPVMNGVDAMKEIKTLPNGVSTPIIALTAHALTGDRDRYIGLGFDGYHSKPINKTKLFNLLSRLTSSDEERKGDAYRL